MTNIFARETKICLVRPGKFVHPYATDQIHRRVRVQVRVQVLVVNKYFAVSQCAYA